MVRVLNKDAFCEIVLKSCGPEKSKATLELFKNADVESHNGARRLLATMVGQDPLYPSDGYQELPTSPAVEQRLFPSLPYWSPLDEI